MSKKKGEILIREAPEKFKLEDTTIWSFPERGSWATHSGKYRGNWSPYIPRNLILRYSKKNDWILDQFLGSGTTLIEAKLLGRNAIGVDINSEAINYLTQILILLVKKVQKFSQNKEMQLNYHL